MAKLTSVLSFLALCGLNLFEKTPDVGSASLRLALVVIFAAGLAFVARDELEAFIG